MSHEHSHTHSHSHGHNNNSYNLLIVLILTGIYMITEFAGGLYTNSLALTADAGHMLCDFAALSLSYFAMWLAKQPAPPEKTYGYFRVEIFAAFINGIALVVIALFIIFDACTRLVSPPEIKSGTMLIIAVGGLIINIIGVFLLHQESKENLNIKGAFIHIIGDLLGSVGAIIAGTLIFKWHLYLADPIISIVIAALILFSSLKLANSAIQVLLEASPSHINIEEIKTAILELKDVIGVHDLHVWSIDSNKISLSVHIVSEFIDNKTVLCEVNNLLKEKFNISHSTIQIEPKGFFESDCSKNKY